nr:2-hydroxyacyl-CoA dehydratase [Desulfobacterales bacterium]
MLPSKNKSINRWKEEGKKVFGYMCTNIPEELIYAAGILPVRLTGKPVDIVEANKHHAIYMCHHARSVMEVGLLDEYECLDGIVNAYGCEGSCNIFQVLGLVLAFDFFLNFFVSPIMLGQTWLKGSICRSYRSLSKGWKNT